MQPEAWLSLVLGLVFMAVICGFVALLIRSQKTRAAATTSGAAGQAADAVARGAGVHVAGVDRAGRERNADDVDAGARAGPAAVAGGARRPIRRPGMRAAGGAMAAAAAAAAGAGAGEAAPAAVPEGGDRGPAAGGPFLTPEQQKRAEAAAARAAEQERREQAEREAEEVIRKAREEREKREEEEYQTKWRSLIAVEESGDASEVATDEQVVAFVQQHKVVAITDVAVEFSITQQEAISRLRALEESGALSGVFDDRGKFVYLSRAELESIADYIKRRGRVAISDLVGQFKFAESTVTT